ncbi:MAG: hypothetical protein IT384_27235 [Deltaproteobacteria bacterium]|nr:hypothetical protein [Deltaproteobacteria bacterium]
MKPAGPTLLLLAFLAVPLSAFGQEPLPPEGVEQAVPAPFAYSANGPGSGHGASAIGMGVLVSRRLAFPALTVQYTHGLGEIVDFFIAADLGISTEEFGLLFFINPGVAVRVTGQRSSELGLALRASPEVVVLVGSGGGGAIFGATPGLVLSTGSPKLQFSLGVDVPMYFGAIASFGGHASGGTGGFAAALRPYLALEAAVSPDIGLFLKVAPLFFVSGSGGFLWLQVAAGVGF